VGKALWEKAESLDQNIKSKQADQSTIMAKRKRAENTPIPPWDLAKLEGDYWNLDTEISALQKQVGDILSLLERIDGDQEFSDSEVFAFVPELKPEEEHLSKKKLALIRDGKYTADTPHSEGYGFGHFFRPAVSATPTNGRFVTTGRNATKVQGAIDPMFAEEEFNYRTADTHGGKVRGGSHANGFFVDAKGRKHRKCPGNVARRLKR
jgi:hypothetical protein